MDVQQSTVTVMNSCPALCSTEYGSADSSPAGEHGLCTDNLESAAENEGESGNHEVASSADEPVSSVQSTSPDLNCPICLGRLENRSYTDTCFHKFCFVCLVEWSKVKPVCPLCKQPFTSVIHNVQSYENFEQLPITPGSTGTAAAADSNRSRFRYPTTVIHGSSERRRQRESLQRPSRLRHRGSSRFDVPPPAFTSSFRRSVYRDGLWVRSVNESGRYRDTSAAFFARNPTAVHRLMPWLNRELMALLRNPADVTFLLEVILSTVLRVDITSETFYDLVSPFLGARTRHFIHEFHTFARSPFNMEAYDTRTIYERPPQIASSAPIEFSDSNSSSDSSDAEIVEINPLVVTNELSPAVNYDELAMTEEPFTVGDSMQNVIRNMSPQPGPSHSHLQDIPLPTPSHLSHVQQNSSAMSSRHQSPLSLDEQSAGGNAGNNDDEDSDAGDIEIIAEDKPWTDRSPVVLSSGESDADNEIELLHQTSSTLDAPLSADASQEVLSSVQDERVDSGTSEHDLELIADVVDMQKKNTVEITPASDSRQSLKKSHDHKRHHRRASKHKHKDHKYSGHHHEKDLHYESESVSASHYKQETQRLKTSDDITTDSELKCDVSASFNSNEEISDSYHMDSQVWLSDDSSDSSEYRSVRSVVVVPQAFKKNSSGHKRSKRDSL